MELLENLQAEQQLFTEKSKKTKQMALIFGGASAVVFLVSIALVFWPSFTDLNEKKTNISLLQAEIDGTLKSEKIKIEGEVEVSEKKLKDTEEKYGKILPKILPLANDEFEYQDRLSELAVFFEDYSFRYGTEKNPFKLDAISFSAPVYEAGIYRIPIQMTINTTNESMKNFADMILRSGSMDEKDFYKYTLPTIPDPQPVPVMTLDNLVVDYKATAKKPSSSSPPPEGETEKIQTSSFSINLSVFFKETEWMQKTYGGGGGKKK